GGGGTTRQPRAGGGVGVAAVRAPQRRRAARQVADQGDGREPERTARRSGGQVHRVPQGRGCGSLNMAWKYKKDEEAAKGCPVGKHEATLAAVEDKVSRNGNNMRVCTFTVYLPGGGEYRVKDYFVEGNGYAVARMHDLANALGAEQDW